jgi:4-amino-4-deoxy-L-arabinose transferase-like glycosyltransferase
MNKKGNINAKGIISPGSKFWFILMFIIAFFGPWMGIFLFAQYKYLSFSDVVIKVIFMTCTLTVIFMVIRTIMMLGNSEFKKVLFGALLATIAAISFVVALVMYLGM